jgi:hypothetical protein
MGRASLPTQAGIGTALTPSPNARHSADRPDRLRPPDQDTAGDELHQISIRTWRGIRLGAAVGVAAVVSAVVLTGVPAGATVAANPVFIYWSNSGGSTIGRARLDGTGVEPRWITGLNAPCGVAVGASHIYWADMDGTTVGRANLDGTHVSRSFIKRVDSTPRRDRPDRPRPG